MTETHGDEGDGDEGDGGERVPNADTTEPAADGAVSARLGDGMPPTPDLLVLGGAVLLCIAFAPVFVVAPYSPRVVILVGFLPLGVAALVSLCRRRDRAALAAAAFVVVATISALVSANPRISLVGQMGKEASAVLLLAFIGWWAIGRHLGQRGRELLPYALLIGLGLNAVVAVLQVAIHNTSSSFGVADGGRAPGLTANPVQLGALMAAGVAISGTFALSRSGRWIAWMVAVAGFSAAANLSGTRVAIVSIAVLLVAWLIIHRSWRVVVAGGAAVAGVLVSDVFRRTATTTSRLTDGFDRQGAWLYGLRSFLSRPLLGFGPGGFRGAIQHRYSAAFVRTAAFDDRRSAWFDAHNVAIEYLVATGIIGLCLLCVFVWFSARARGPLMAAFVAIAITWSLQPMSVSTAPIALLALGAAAPAAIIAADDRVRHRRPVIAIAGVIGVVLAVSYAAIDLRLQAAVDSGSATRIESAAGWFPSDAAVADIVASGWANAYLFEHADKQHLLFWAHQVVEREPDRPYWWAKYASTQVSFGDDVGARASLDTALTLEPWSPTAWPLMLELAKRTNDAELHTLALGKVCELQLKACTQP